MLSWLTTDVAIVLLLTTTFVFLGMLSVWAAKSRQHWFVRMAVVFAILAPLLAIPAYDLFLAFAIALAFTWLMILLQYVVRARRKRQESSVPTPTPKLAFSLRSILLAMAVVAVALAVLIHVPNEVWQIWPFWFAGGMMLGVAYSALVNFGLNTRLRWYYRIQFILLSVLAACPASMFGAGLIALIGVNASNALTGISPPFRFLLRCSVGIVSTAVLAVGLILLDLTTRDEAAALKDTPRTRLPITRLPKYAALGVFLALVALPPIVTVWELAHPLPIPAESIPKPNGVIELAEIGDKASQSNIVTLYEAEPIDFERLAAAIEADRAVYDKIAAAFTHSSWIPVIYDNSNFNNMGHLTGRRGVARLLAAKSAVEINAGKWDDAFHTHCQLLRTGELMHQGGFAIDFLVATAIDSMAYQQIYKSVNSLNPQQCRAMLKELLASEGQRHGIEDVLYREHIFIQRSMGWPGHLVEFIERICRLDQTGWQIDREVVHVHERTQALARLLILKLAIRAFQLDHGSPPASLTGLVPEYLSTIPLDPFDPAGGPLRYKLNGDHPVLYSVGRDQDDDGGDHAPATNILETAKDGSPDGDLDLEKEFAEDEPSADEATTTQAKS
ncbi:MAG: hypothetical protein IT425_08110 [Pirellulales bacterium]|nr:hypothetical protein [Pirellulales bacterium]